MDLTAKTVCFIGDSITQGCGASNEEKYGYVGLFKKAHPEATVYNFGIGGTRIAEQRVKPYNPDAPHWDTNPFYTRLENMPNYADLICVFGGTNDYGHGDAPMGKFGDTTHDTFYGAVSELIIKLIDKYPYAKIVFFTPLHREAEFTTNSKPDGDFCLKDYVLAIKETCEYYSIPVLDLYSVSGMQPEIPLIKELFMPDGLHPNDDGYRKLFNTIAAYVKTL